VCSASFPVCASPFYVIPEFNYVHLFIASKVLASAPAGYKEGSSGSLALSTGQSKSGQGTSGSISVITGDTSGGPAGGINIEVGETVSKLLHEHNPLLEYSHLKTLPTERKP
jgi:hypothetical protein